MQRVYHVCRQFRLGDTLLKQLVNNISPYSFISIDRFNVRLNHCSRGPLPWESKSKFPDQPEKKFRKKKTEKVQEKYCPQDCEVLKRPKRNTYEWVIEDAKPCKPFGVKALVDKTVCEMRRIKKCIRLCGAGPQCENLAPDCSRITKVYPMREACMKGSLPGCAKPLPVSEKTK